MCRLRIRSPAAGKELFIRKSGRRRGCGLRGRTIWIADAHRGDGKRFIMRVEEKLTVFLEFEPTVHTR